MHKPLQAPVFPSRIPTPTHRREFGEARFDLGDDKDVHRRGGLDVVKCKGALVLIHNAVGQLGRRTTSSREQFNNEQWQLAQEV